MMRRVAGLAGVLLCLLLVVRVALAQADGAAASGPVPVNPHASSEARALLRYLDSISGKYTITGQHNFPNAGSRWTDRTYDLTGKYPGLFGEDFGFSGEDDKDSILGRPGMIAEVERQYRNGAVIALMWHAVRPSEDEPVGFRDSVQGHLTDFEFTELLTPGTDLYKRWCAQVDAIAGYLTELRDAHVLWAGLAEFSNPPEKLREVFEGPNLLNRGDPRLADAMEAMRKASRDASPEPVTVHSSEEARVLLGRLYGVSGKSTLSGQENDARALLGSTEHVVEVTGQSPAIYGADLGITKEDGVEVDAVRRAIVEEAKRQSKIHAMVSLSWHAARPTDDEPGTMEQSVRGQLTDFEWNELLTPDTDLYQRWCAQVDEVAKYLKQLQDAKVAVLWRPYPEANGKKFWWAGRKGVRGSAALYRQLFDRLVHQDGLRNLIWVWDAAPPGFGPNATGAYADYFPGLLYVDALALNVENPNSRFRLDVSLSLMGGGKVIGIGFEGKIPDPSWFQQQTGWTWFLVAPEPAPPAATAAQVPPASPVPPENVADPAEALRKLYADPRVVSQTVEPRRGASSP